MSWVEGRIHWRANGISAGKQLRLQEEYLAYSRPTQLEMIQPRAFVLNSFSKV